MDQIDKARAFPRGTFHDLVTLSRLATWGLGPVLTAENLGHEETTRRSKYRPFHFSYSLFSFLLFIFFLFFIFNLIFLIAGITIMRENKEKTITSGDKDAPHRQWSRKLPSKQGRENLSLYLVLWIWTSFQVVKVLRSKNLARLLFPRFPSLHPQR